MLLLLPAGGRGELDYPVSYTDRAGPGLDRTRSRPNSTAPGWIGSGRHWFDTSQGVARLGAAAWVHGLVSGSSNVMVWNRSAAWYWLLVSGQYSSCGMKHVSSLENNPVFLDVPSPSLLIPHESVEPVALVKGIHLWSSFEPIPTRSSE